MNGTGIPILVGSLQSSSVSKSFSRLQSLLLIQFLIKTDYLDLVVDQPNSGVIKHFAMGQLTERITSAGRIIGLLNTVTKPTLEKVGGGVNIEKQYNKYHYVTIKRRVKQVF